MKILRFYPPPRWGRIEVGVDTECPLLTPPSPTKGEGDNWVIFYVKICQVSLNIFLS
jgi:hypothetical protein